MRIHVEKGNRNRMMSPAERQKHQGIERRANQSHKMQRPNTPNKSRFSIHKKPYQKIPKDRSLTTIPYDQHRFVKNLIIKELEDGAWFKDACILSGIDESTGHRWKKADASFASDVELAILKYKRSLITYVNNGAKDDPKIALEVLRTRWGEDWNVVKKVDVTSQGKQIKGTVTIIKLPQNGREKSN